jgi:DNA replication initiation complex subunit (GINS family)
VDNLESIQAAIEQAEHKEREKYLEMDVDVIFTLRDIRAILEKLIGMETILQDLEAVCRKRSEQIISPPWEAKGSL